MPVNAFPKKIYTNDSVIAYYQTCDLTDGTWTLLDSTNMIDTVANAGTGNNIRLNAVGVANNELQIVGSGGTSVITHSDVNSKLAILDALINAVLDTFVGSIIPNSIISPYSPLAAL